MGATQEYVGVRGRKASGPYESSLDLPVVSFCISFCPLISPSATSSPITVCKTDVVTQPEFFNRDFQKRIFAGLFHRANSYDHCPEIKFQRIWPKFFEFFSDISFADGDIDNPDDRLQPIINKYDRSEGSGEAVRRFVTLNYQLSYGHY